MGIGKLGTAIGKEIIALARTGSKSLLATRPVKVNTGKSLLNKQASIFHGINPALTYLPTGKTYELPRFCTVEMKLARQMNKIASSQIKAPVNSTFPKANAEDLRRLTSETIEDSYSRVQWTNPKDGKIYNLLKQGETEDGKVIVRILDKDGAFIKEAEIRPKEIAIIDNSYGSAFELPYGLDSGDLPNELSKLSHAKAVEIFAKRNNPFARYTIFETGCNSGSSHIDIDKLISNLKNLQQGKRFDYVNCSLGSETYNVTETCESIVKKVCAEVDRLHSKRGTRVLFASGNGDGGPFRQKAVNRYILNSSTAEGVGSLNKRGIISYFSSSRNSKFCQHYEQGEFLATQTSDGINISGQYGTDIIFSEKNPFVGMKLRDILKVCDEKPEMWKYIRELGFKNGGENKDDIAFLVFSGKIRIDGTSLATPIRTAKLALNDMMQGIL